MEININFDEKMMVETVNRVLDEFEYKGKTIREWADSIANPRTNADRIRSMTDEELAEFLDCYCVSASWECQRHNEIKCYECWLDWLKQEVTGNDS